MEEHGLAGREIIGPVTSVAWSVSFCTVLRLSAGGDGYCNPICTVYMAAYVYILLYCIYIYITLIALYLLALHCFIVPIVVYE